VAETVVLGLDCRHATVWVLGLSRSRAAGRADRAELRLATVRRHEEQHALFDARPDHAGECPRRCKVAWTYATRDEFKGFGECRRSRRQSTRPLRHESKLRVLRSDATTGAELWSFDPTGGRPSSQRFRHRGIVVTGDGCSSPIATPVRLDRKTRTADHVVRRQQRVRRCARLRSSGRADQCEARHAGRCLWGPALIGSHPSPRRCRRRPETFAPTT